MAWLDRGSNPQRPASEMDTLTTRLLVQLYKFVCKTDPTAYNIWFDLCFYTYSWTQVGIYDTQQNNETIYPLTGHNDQQISKFLTQKINLNIQHLEYYPITNYKFA